jgi:hypothetical protein
MVRWQYREIPASMTPNTLAVESTTAMESLDLPMAQVAEACHTCTALFRIKPRISASLVTLGPGGYSSQIVMFRGAQTCRVRLNAASATSTSAGCVSLFGLMTRATLVSVLMIVTLPRKRGATRAAVTEP